MDDIGKTVYINIYDVSHLNRSNRQGCARCRLGSPAEAEVEAEAARVFRFRCVKHLHISQKIKNEKKSSTTSAGTTFSVVPTNKAGNVLCRIRGDVWSY